MCKLDDYITGENDPNAPFNQKETPCQPDEIWECLDDENYDRAYELLEELRKDVCFLRDYAKSVDNVFLLKKLNKIYNKL